LRDKKDLNIPHVRLIAVIALSAAAVLLLGGCNSRKETPAVQGNTVTEDYEAEAQIDSEQESGLPLETPLGTLEFPGRFGDAVYSEDVSDDDNFAAEYYGTVAGDKVSLFTLSIGSGGSGYLIGTARALMACSVRFGSISARLSRRLHGLRIYS
jgi:hypothetical protein